MEQVIVGGYYDLLNITTTEYNLVADGYDWHSDSDIWQPQTVSTPGKLKNLRVELDGIPGTGTYTFTLRRRVGLGAWVNTALTCTVLANGTVASDTVNEVSVAAGDVIILECNPDAPDNARYAIWTIEFEGDNANESLLLTNGFLTSASDHYLPVQGYGDSNSEDDVRQVCPTSGVIKDLYVQLSTDPGDTWRFKLRINGVDSDDGGNPLQVTITGTDRTGNDITHDITVSAGDVLTISADRILSPNTVWAHVGMTFVADTDGESLILGGTRDNLHTTDTEYNYLSPYAIAFWNATEAQRYNLAQACTLRKLYMLLSGAPSSGKNYTFTVRLEGASPGSGLVVVIADLATTGNDVSNDITVLDGKTVGMMVVPTGTPTTRDAYWGLVGYIEPVVVGLENKSANMAAKLMARGML